MMEILGIWFKIIMIIALWEAWKFIGWELINWWVSKQADKYDRNNKQ